MGIDEKTGRPRALRIELERRGSRSTDAERVQGTVKSFKDQWGWIESSQMDSDVFAHVEDVVVGVLQKGAAVTFEVGTDEKSGKPRALHIEVHNNQLGSSRMSGNRLSGSVKQFKDPWGWISSSSVEGDVFAHNEDCVNGVLYANARVTFELGVDSKSGRNRAKRIQVQGGHAGGHGGGQRIGGHMGVIAQWKDKWGWISSPEFRDGDIFAHAEDLLTPVALGMQVTFRVSLDPKGRRRASDISAAASDPGMGRGAAGVGMGGRGALMASAPAAGRGGAATPAMFTGRQMTGQVTSWKDKWGWVSCPYFEGDIFAHVEDIRDGFTPTVGARVQFVVGTDQKTGRARALEITAHGGTKRKSDEMAAKDSERDAAFQGMEGTTAEGEIVQWKESWGWMRCSGVSTDIFAHKEDVVTGEELAVGQMCSFTISKDTKKPERFRAVNIVPMGAAVKKRK
eukprot:gnl/TRDRNA2_/TRDRNA2_164195_c1_seq1.p1 gnl/TRDRNA2_/TRDRNA2_164195_c1~~gnl/TRDRNA2_/TRDRNA2_164195_c1_seq1.p1  ORF type:complete len:513 (+),score=96.15 gnl/TRDRNA2_/TRDRNA2_164195_c1_seq1:180-1541(+)